MALGDLKEKLKKPFHRSRNRQSTSTTGSPSQTPNRSSVASDRPAHDRLSHERNGGFVGTVSKAPVAPVTPTSNHTSSRESSITSPIEHSLDRAAAPGLHNVHNTDYKLPQVPHESDFSLSFTGLTSGSQQPGRDGGYADGRFLTQLEEGRNSVNIADRNLAASTPNAPSLRLVPQPNEQLRSQPLIPTVDHHSTNFADWNMVRNDKAAAGSRDDAPQPLNVKKRVSNQHGAEALTSNGLELDHSEVRDASWSVTPLAMEGLNDKSPLDARGKISNLNRETATASESQLAPRRSSLDRPLPLTPPATMALDRPLSSNNRAFGDALTGDASASDEEAFLAHAKQIDSAGPFNLEGVDVKREPDTVSLHEYHAPAVTHEVIKEERHYTRQQVITRETHDYHIYHRILPIIDIEVLPARHFVPIQQGFVEIDEEELPGRTRDKVHWAIAEMVSKRMPESRDAVVAKHFSARTFEGVEHDDKEYIGPEGHPVTEKWWVYPPTLGEDAYRAGQTYPFHFGSADPRDDGLKATLPAGNIVGVSKRLMEKRQREAERMAAAAEGKVVRKPVPGH